MSMMEGVRAAAAIEKQKQAETQTADPNKEQFKSNPNATDAELKANGPESAQVPGIEKAGIVYSPDLQKHIDAIKSGEQSTYVGKGQLFQGVLQGEMVAWIQETLQIPVTGEYDATTQKAIKDFQAAHRDAVKYIGRDGRERSDDGIVGKLTIAELLKEREKVTPETKGEVAKEEVKIETMDSETAKALEAEKKKIREERIVKAGSEIFDAVHRNGTKEDVIFKHALTLSKDEWSEVRDRWGKDEFSLPRLEEYEDPADWRDFDKVLNREMSKKLDAVLSLATGSANDLSLDEQRAEARSRLMRYGFSGPGTKDSFVAAAMFNPDTPDQMITVEQGAALAEKYGKMLAHDIKREIPVERAFKILYVTGTFDWETTAQAAHHSLKHDSKKGLFFEMAEAGLFNQQHSFDKFCAEYDGGAEGFAADCKKRLTDAQMLRFQGLLAAGDRNPNS